MEIFQHYQVLKRPDGSAWELGRGAMGVTYKAFDTNLRCNVALKVINAAYLESEMAQQRFLREARAAAGLSHPNVASVFHLGESGGNYFYAMEFIDGETLEAFVRREGPLPPLLALQITLQVARALRAASRVGLVHRDIKPGNLMLLRHDDEDEIHVKVIDFGLAKLSHVDGEGSATITVAGFVGTPHFASPEQLEEKDLDVRSDMYSLGVSLWYMLAGRPPFAGSVVQIMSQQLTRQPPFEQLTGLPPEVMQLLEHLLEKDAAKRPQSAADLRREIEHVIQALRTPGAAAATVGGQTSPGEEIDPTSFPTEAATEEGALIKEAAAPAKPPRPAGGVVLAPPTKVPLGHATPGPVGQPALLTHDLLGGKPAADGNSAAQPPLPALSDGGNKVLRTALQPGDSATYANAAGFPAALRASVTETPAHPAVLTPQSLPAVVPLNPLNGQGESPRRGVRSAKVAILVVAAACIFLGLLAGLGFAAWKILLPAMKQPSASAQASPARGSSASGAGASPGMRRALPIVAHVTPLPRASPVPAASTPTPAAARAARFRELLAKAQSLDRDGDAAGALNGYVALAQDYPELDQGLSRVDSFISGVRAAPLAPEAEAGRAKQLRAPMERAARLGSDLAMVYLGDHLLASEPATAAEWYREAADKGEPEAMFALGNMYFTGAGVPRQPAEAGRYFTLASDKGYVRAKIYLAECYEEGKGGVARNFDQAFALLNAALGLDPNNAIAMERLAIDYERGRGTPVDAPKAFALMKRAVELGNVNAMGNLGVYYMNGLGQPHKNPREAAALFKQGADKNNVVCMFFYAQCVFEGVEGTPPNRAVAVSYYRAAAERGFPPARAWCKENNVSFAGSN